MSDLAEQSADPDQHLLALDGVLLDDPPLLRSELAGLVDDLVRDPNLPDVMEQRGELCIAPLSGRQPELVDDCERQVDDVLAVFPRVRVVGLDDVPEEERGPTVGIAQLELVVDAHPPLAREDRKQSDERQGEQHASW